MRLASLILIILTSIVHAVAFDCIEVLPIQSESIPAKGYSVEVSQDNTFWTQINLGVFENSGIVKKILTGRQSCKYLKININSGYTTNTAAIAELNLSLNGVLLNRSGWIVTCDSQATESSTTGGPQKMIDGAYSTSWHSSWPLPKPFPYWVKVDLGTDVDLGLVKIVWDVNLTAETFNVYVNDSFISNVATNLVELSVVKHESSIVSIESVNSIGIKSPKSSLKIVPLIIYESADLLKKTEIATVFTVYGAKKFFMAAYPSNSIK